MCCYNRLWYMMWALERSVDLGDMVGWVIPFIYDVICDVDGQLAWTMQWTAICDGIVTRWSVARKCTWHEEGRRLVVVVFWITNKLLFWKKKISNILILECTTTLQDQTEVDFLRESHNHLFLSPPSPLCPFSSQHSGQRGPLQK